MLTLGAEARLDNRRYKSYVGLNNTLDPNAEIIEFKWQTNKDNPYCNIEFTTDVNQLPVSFVFEASEIASAAFTIRNNANTPITIFERKKSEYENVIPEDLSLGQSSPLREGQILRIDGTYYILETHPDFTAGAKLTDIDFRMLAQDEAERMLED